MALEHEVMTHLNLEDKPFFGMTVKQFAVVFGTMFIAMFMYGFVLSWLADIPRLVVTGILMLPAVFCFLFKPNEKALLDWFVKHFFFKPTIAMYGYWEVQNQYNREKAVTDEAEAEAEFGEFIFTELVDC